MKKLILLLLLPFSVNLLLAQNYLLQGPTTAPTNSNIFQDANGLIGIPTTKPAANLDVAGGCGFCETPIPIIAPHYGGGMSPAPDYIMAWRDFLELGGGSYPSSIPDFNVNPLGQVGIGGVNESSGPYGANDLLIQTHGWPMGIGLGLTAINPNTVISSYDDNGNLLFQAGNWGTETNSSGVITVVGNSNISLRTPPVFQVLDGAGNLSNPIIAASGTGAIGMGTYSPMAQLDIMNSTYVDGGSMSYLLHVGNPGIMTYLGTGGQDYFTVANDPNVGVAIGIAPTGFSTLAIQGSSVTTFDLFEQSGQPAGIRFYGADGTQRHVIYDDVGLTGNLIIWPGADEPGVSNTLEVIGTTQVDVDLAVGGNSAITGNETVGGNESVTGNAAVGGNATVAGTLAIGSVTTPSGYNLYVQNGILSERYKCALASSTDWSDYVFDNGYNMMKLQDLAKYIQKNKHLPEIPTADETVKNGIDLGQMDAKLLAKVEELTLYIIKQQEEIDALKKSLKTK